MIKHILVSSLLLVAVFAQAQESTFSPYSIHGIGISKFRGSVGNVSIGGLTFVSNPVEPSVLNAATYAELTKTNFAVGGSYAVGQLEDTSGKSDVSNVSFDYLSIAIPANKFGFGFGIVPFTASGYRINQDFPERTISQTGTGNVNRVFLGAGAKVYKGLALGAEFQYNFGRIEGEITQINNNINIANTRRIDQSDIAGFSYAFSAIYDYNVSEKHVFRTSLKYEFSSNITSTNNQQTADVIIDVNGLVRPVSELTTRNREVPNRSFKLPSRFTVGASFSKKSYWLVGAEIYTGSNNSYQDRFQNRNTNETTINYIDPFGVKIGGYYQPNYQSFKSYFERIIYRAGARYEKTGLQFNNEDINEFGISFGLGLPLKQGLSTINLGFEGGKRGTTSGGAVEESFVNFSIGLNLSDKWFRKRKFN